MQWTRRRIGYVVWGAGFLFFVVPELLAAVPLTESQLPFPTISRTIGHLEAIDPAWEILPTVLIVLFMYALFRAPQNAVDPHDSDDERPALRAFVRNAAICTLVIVGVTIWAFLHWPDQVVNGHKLPNFEVAYVLYGVTFLVWVVVPTYVVLRTNRFPSLVQSVLNAEQWLRSFGKVGRGAAWLVGFVLVWGMVFLLLHLTLYPFPNITRELNHTEITCGTEVVSRWHEGCVVHG